MKLHLHNYQNFFYSNTVCSDHYTVYTWDADGIFITILHVFPSEYQNIFSIILIIFFSNYLGNEFVFKSWYSTHCTMYMFTAVTWIWTRIQNTGPLQWFGSGSYTLVYRRGSDPYYMHTLVSAGVRIRILNTGVRHRFGI